MHDLALIKLGGSVVTFKDKPLAANGGAIEKIAAIIGSIRLPTIIVHGGGSFGHHWSVKYDMHTKASNYDAHGVAVVHESMVALNQIIVNSMIEKGLNPYGISPSALTNGHRPILAKLKMLYSMAKAKVIPVTFGDVVHIQGSKYSILSGDSLMTIISKALLPTRVIFATNVDGVYSDVKSGRLLHEIDSRKDGISIGYDSRAGADVTGGMRRKITEALKIAKGGMDVVLVNGLQPERILDAVEGRSTVGTLVRKRRGRS
jgi:isopentenyl phosphate kinase